MADHRRPDDNQDEIVYCERCGISFLWSAEERKTGGEEPVFCPGCRFLTPADKRERGLVKWFNRKKKYGFILRAEDGELFAHRSEVKGGNTLRVGDLVEFDVADGERGQSAVDVRVLERGPAA